MAGDDLADGTNGGESDGIVEDYSFSDLKDNLTALFDSYSQAFYVLQAHEKVGIYRRAGDKGSDDVMTFMAKRVLLKDANLQADEKIKVEEAKELILMKMYLLLKNAIIAIDAKSNGDNARARKDAVMRLIGDLFGKYDTIVVDDFKRNFDLVKSKGDSLEKGVTLNGEVNFAVQNIRERAAKVGLIDL